MNVSSQAFAGLTQLPTTNTPMCGMLASDGISCRQLNVYFVEALTFSFRLTGSYTTCFYPQCQKLGHIKQNHTEDLHLIDYHSIDFILKLKSKLVLHEILMC